MPPGLLGIDRRIAYSHNKYYSGVQTCCEHFSLSKSMLLSMPLSYLSDVLLRHSMQHYSVEMFSRALAKIEFIMVRCRLISIAELSLSCSDLAQFICEVCT